MTKHHGLGNDFLIVLDEATTPDREPGPALARALCDRRTGLGADGLIHATTTPDADVDAVFNLWNADGGVAEISGNGLRCLAQAIAQHRGLHSTILTLATQGGLRRASVRPGATPHTADVEVEMGAVTSGPPLPDGVSVPGQRAATASIGNPHLVVLVDDVDAMDVATDGAALAAAFPGGINVEFVAVPDPDTIQLRVWERGVGITAACGSGACAAAAVARDWGLVGDRVDVRMPGGVATVGSNGDGLILAGPSTYVASIQVPAEACDA